MWTVALTEWLSCQAVDGTSLRSPRTSTCEAEVLRALSREKPLRACVAYRSSKEILRMRSHPQASITQRYCGVLWQTRKSACAFLENEVTGRHVAEIPQITWTGFDAAQFIYNH